MDRPGLRMSSGQDSFLTLCMGMFSPNTCVETHETLFGIFLFLFTALCQIFVLTELSLSNFPCVEAQSPMSQHK